MNSYQIVNKKTNVPEYIIKHDTDDVGVGRYILYYSHGGQWGESHRGKLQLTMIDNGNYIVFKPQLPKKFDYSIFEKVRVLIQFQELLKSNNTKAEYIIMKEELVGEI